MLRNFGPRAAISAIALCLVCPAAALAGDAGDKELNAVYAARAKAVGTEKNQLFAAADKYPHNLRLQLEAAYALLATKDPRANIYLERAAKLAPGRKDVQAQLGYAQLAAKDMTGARRSFKAALALDPADADLRMQLVYTEDAIGLKRAASENAAIVAAGPSRAPDGCNAYRNLAGQSDRRLPKPWFGDVYAEPEWRTRDRIGIASGQLRLGRTLGEGELVEAYGTLRATWDTRSRATALGPEIFYDDAATLGGGVRAKPFAGSPVSFFAEQGVAIDLMDRDRHPARNDTRIGAIFGWDWMAPSACSMAASLVFRPFVNVYGDAVWYSRYDDLFGFARTRLGARVFESPLVTVDAYAVGSINADSAGRSVNRMTEAGGGVALTLMYPYRITLRAEKVHVTSGYRAGTNDHRFRLEQQFNF